MTKDIWPWTRVKDTDLFETAQYEIIKNSVERKLAYHNIDHVRSMYNFLESIQEPYDEVLDWAVLFHDIVYDEKPMKELRSGMRFLELANQEGCSLPKEDWHKVVQLVLNTEKHEDISCPLVLADLHQLTDSVQTFKNFNAIMSESMALYSINETEFAASSQQYMRALQQRLSNAFNGKFINGLWTEVMNGISRTIVLAKIVQGQNV